jgi:mRNA interferase RelE/StbE
MEPNIRKLILAWIDKNLEGTDNPRLFGEPLQGNRSDQWRYRIGDYRVLAEIDDSTVTVLVIKVGNRRDVYK